MRELIYVATYIGITLVDNELADTEIEEIHDDGRDDHSLYRERLARLLLLRQLTSLWQTAPSSTSAERKERTLSGPRILSGGNCHGQQAPRCCTGLLAAVNAPHLVALVRAGALFHKSKLLE